MFTYLLSLLIVIKSRNSAYSGRSRNSNRLALFAQTFKYGDNIEFAEDFHYTFNDSPLWVVQGSHTYNWNGQSGYRSLSFRREGPWNDVTMAAKGEMDGEEVAMDATFKNEFGRIEGNVKVNTPFEGYT